jgi:hypothetical protein
LIIIPQEFQHFFVSNFIEALVLLRIETRLEKDNGVFMAIADKAFVLLAEFPLFASVVVEILLVWKVIVV